MGATWIVQKSEDEKKFIDNFDEALYEFLKLIYEDGAEDAALRWSS